MHENMQIKNNVICYKTENIRDHIRNKYTTTYKLHIVYIQHETCYTIDSSVHR